MFILQILEIKKRHTRNTQNVALAVRSPPVAVQSKPALESPKGMIFYIILFLLYFYFYFIIFIFISFSATKKKKQKKQTNKTNNTITRNEMKWK